MAPHLTQKFLLLLLTLLSHSCIDKSSLIATYQIDKFIPSNNSKYSTEISYGWEISLQENDIFVLRAKETITGTWVVLNKEKDNFRVRFKSADKLADATIKGNIIYFTNPNSLFNNIFNHVIFVKIRP
ncbi:MAG: hypothetical protein ACO1OQ_11365 [Rufibacter sp.]